MNDNTDDAPERVVYVVDPTMSRDVQPELVTRTDIDNECTVTGVVIDPADRQQLLYGTVTGPDGRFIGSFFPADIVRQSEWRVVTADGAEYRAPSEGHAVVALTTTLRRA
ncbi:hypothetical protein NQK81_27780 [Amycolatopsis roodepoortensis]|uniref:hypothetical protein n=1 Tax=Amycolatopsis roodepoortensis TaxID=700274 RepID=UPI00214CC0DC|nr:hypothetical protein [Amycolatopsis roodepoortensis]UUV28577.1 hypothetical protein NQK81_27780 [Amycolatopsis roodepoortensis]